MLIDHTGAAVVRYMLTTEEMLCFYNILRDIGRIAFPIFCFLLVEGFLHTSDVKKYEVRLGMFALISEIPFDLAVINHKMYSYMSHQNVFFTLLLGLMVMIAFRYIECTIPAGSAWQWTLYLFCMGAGAGIAYLFKTDYSYKGIVCIMVIYLFRTKRIWQCAAGALSFFWELPAPLAFIPIYFYNGKRGLRMKYFFYAFYPVHLLVLYIIAHYIMKLY